MAHLTQRGRRVRTAALSLYYVAVFAVSAALPIFVVVRGTR